TDHAALALAPLLPMPIDTTRTSSPYFSPNSAMAPVSSASSSAISRVSTAEFCSTKALAMLSTAATSAAVIGLGCEKSKRRRGGPAPRAFFCPVRPHTPGPAPGTTKGGGLDQRAFLCHVGPQHLAQSLVQQMGGGVIGAGPGPALVIDAELDRIARSEAARLDPAEMHDHIAQPLLRAGHLEASAVGPLDQALVADLATRFAIKRRLVEDD